MRSITVAGPRRNLTGIPCPPILLCGGQHRPRRKDRGETGIRTRIVNLLGHPHKGALIRARVPRRAFSARQSDSTCLVPRSGALNRSLFQDDTRPWRQDDHSFIPSGRSGAARPHRDLACGLRHQHPPGRLQKRRGDARRLRLHARADPRRRRPGDFDITNGGTSKVSEMELKNASGIILGESENVVEGVPGSFSLNLKPGKYVVNCPTGDRRGPGQPGRDRQGRSASRRAPRRRC